MYLLPDAKKLTKRKTKAAKQSLNPKFGQMLKVTLYSAVIFLSKEKGRMKECVRLRERERERESEKSVSLFIVFPLCWNMHPLLSLSSHLFVRH